MSLKATPAVSVIVPCYQAEAHLARAARSLLAQTLPDWQAVIVSDDGVDYAAVLRSAGLSDPRFTFASTGRIGSGESHARNTGLDAAASNMIANLDADDALAPAYLATLLPYAREHGLVKAGYDFIDEATLQPVPERVAYAWPTGPVPLPQVAKLLFGHANVCFVYDRARVPVRWRTEIPIWVDSVFLLQAYDHIDAPYFLPQPLYVYYKRAGSAIHRPEAAERFLHSKRQVLAMIAAGGLFSNPQVARVAEDYIRQSAEVQETYIAARERDPDAQFLAFFRRRMEEQGLL